MKSERRSRGREEQYTQARRESSDAAVEGELHRQAVSRPAETVDARVAKRERLAADNILENENLTADLEDDAARPLTNWGVDWARRIARQSADLDDARAEESMGERLRATRQMMRSINQWVAERESMGEEEHAEMFDQVASQAAVAYGDRFRPPDEARRKEFLGQVAQFSGDPAQMVVQLRSLFEPAS